MPAAGQVEWKHQDSGGSPWWNFYQNSQTWILWLAHPSPACNVKRSSFSALFQLNPYTNRIYLHINKQESQRKRTDTEILYLFKEKNIICSLQKHKKGCLTCGTCCGIHHYQLCCASLPLLMLTVDVSGCNGCFPASGEFYSCSPLLSGICHLQWKCLLCWLLCFDLFASNQNFCNYCAFVSLFMCVGVVSLCMQKVIVFAYLTGHRMMFFFISNIHASVCIYVQHFEHEWNSAT